MPRPRSALGSTLEVERGLIRFNGETQGTTMGWQAIKEQPPKGIEEEVLVWGDGWRYPRVASYDPETDEFFDPESCATYNDVTYWWAPIPALSKAAEA